MKEPRPAGGGSFSWPRDRRAGRQRRELRAGLCASACSRAAAPARSTAVARPQGAGNDGVGGAADLARDFLWQERRPQTVAGAERQIPRRRGVGTGDLLDDNHRRDRVDFEAIQRLRNSRASCIAARISTPERNYIGRRSKNTSQAEMEEWFSSVTSKLRFPV